MGRWEVWTLVCTERTLGYHSSVIEILTSSRKPDERQCQADSLTGAVASERVTEAPKGTLRMDGNHSKRAKSEGCLTARPTSRAGTKVGLSDPAVREWNCRRSTDKSYLGDNRLISPRVHIDGEVWHLDVGSSHPGAEAGPKGLAVRQLKRHASWVQNVVRQFGPYPSWAKDT